MNASDGRGKWEISEQWCHQSRRCTSDIGTAGSCYSATPKLHPLRRSGFLHPNTVGYRNHQTDRSPPSSHRFSQTFQISREPTMNRFGSSETRLEGSDYRYFGRATDCLHPDILDAYFLFDDAYLCTRRDQVDTHRPLLRRQTMFSSWDRPPHEIGDIDPFRHRTRWDASSCHDRRVPFSSWDRPRARLQADDDDYEELRHHTMWDTPSRQESISVQWRESCLSLNVSASSVQTSTPLSMAKQEPVTDPIQPIRVSAVEKAERAKQRLCFYCPEKWVRGHVCQTKLLAYFEEDDLEEQNLEDDRDTDKEKVLIQPEPRMTTGVGVTTIHELPEADTVRHAEAEPLAITVELHSEVSQCFAEPVVEDFKLAAQPCLIAASFAFVSLSHELLQKLPNSGNVGCGTKGKHLEGNFVLVGSMERIRRVIDSLGFRLHVARCVFDPGGDISPPFPLCFTSSRCSWFVATWYPP